MLDAEFLLACLEHVAAGRFEMRRTDYLRLLRLAGVEDSDAYRWAALEERDMVPVRGPAIRGLVEMTKEAR